MVLLSASVLAAAVPAARVVFLAVLAWLAFRIVLDLPRLRREGIRMPNPNLAAQIEHNADLGKARSYDLPDNDDNEDKALADLRRAQLNNLRKKKAREKLQRDKQRKDCKKKPDTPCDGAWKCQKSDSSDKFKWRCKTKGEYESEAAMRETEAAKKECADKGWDWWDEGNRCVRPDDFVGS